MNYKKIADVSKELQTDQFKMKIYRMIEQFVYKYHTRYYPHFKGELHDLVLDLFDKFIVPKKHRNGEVFSELDRVEPSEVGGGEWTGTEDKAIATYVQRFVVNRLIDLERSDKQEVLATENYDSDKGGLTLDRAAMGGKRSQGDDGMVAGSFIENIDYNFANLIDNPQAVRNARKFLVDNPEQVTRVRRLLKHYRKDLDPQVIEFIENLLGEEEEPIEEVPFDDLEEKYSAKIVKYNLQSKPAIKVIFSSKEDMNAQDLGTAKKDFKERGYSFYKAHGSNWYFFKDAEQVGDATIEHPATTEAGIKKSQNEFDAYVNNLDSMTTAGLTSPQDIIQTFDEKASENDVDNAVASLLKMKKLNDETDSRSTLWETVKDNDLDQTEVVLFLNNAASVNTKRLIVNDILGSQFYKD